MEKINISTPLGYPIGITKFPSKSDTNKVVLIAPATGVKQTFYESFANHLSENGLTVFTFDYGGIGDSKQSPLSQFNTSALNWGQNDLQSVIEYVTEQYKGSELIIIGHSIGGQIIGLAPSSTQAKKIIMICAQSGYWKLWSGMERIKMWATWNIIFPTLTNIFGYFPGKKVSGMEDLPKGVALEWRRWCLSPNYLFDHVKEKHLHYDSITCPIISYSVDDDSYAPRKAVDWLSTKYRNAQIVRNHLEPSKIRVRKLGHFGFFQKRNSEALWGEVLCQIEKQGFSLL